MNDPNLNLGMVPEPSQAFQRPVYIVTSYSADHGGVFIEGVYSKSIKADQQRKRLSALGVASKVETYHIDIEL